MGRDWSAVPAMTRLTGRLVREGRLLVIVLSIAVALFTFFSLADEVMEGETYALDQAVLLALRAPGDLADPIGPHWLELTAKDLTALGGYPVIGLFTAFAVGFLLLTGRKGAAGLVVASLGGGMVLNTLLKDWFGRPRPDLVPHAVDIFSPSFPSAHAMMSAIAYLTLGALLMRVVPDRRLKIFVMSAAVGIVIAVGASRVYLGVHWPTDVLAGWCVGLAWATAWWLVAALLQRRGRIDGDHDTQGS